MNESVIARHTELGNNYRLWMQTAQKLFAGSQVLRRELERFTANLRSGKARQSEVIMPWTELMLAAFGIECLIKAVWVKRGNQLARDGKYVPMTKNEGHRLVKLCCVAGIPLDSREADALERMSDIARTIGRYPIARWAGEIIPMGCSWSSVDDGIIENLIVRFNTELEDHSGSPHFGHRSK
jgi:hypothetical protein